MSRTSRTKREKRRTLIAIGVVVVALIGISALIATISPRLRAQTAPQPTVAVVELVPPTPTPQIERQEATDEPQMLTHIAPLYAQNNDTVGYLSINNTVIDYPVVFSGDNDYYMTRNFNHEDDEGGAIFMDFRVNFNNIASDRNVILYGHRMRDGSMFKDLTRFENKNFFNENRIIQFDTLYDSHKWEVFAAFQTHIDFYYIQTYFENDEEWLRFLHKCADLSKFETDTKFYATDTILTLSTCTSLNPNKRWVVMARLID